MHQFTNLLPLYIKFSSSQQVLSSSTPQTCYQESTKIGWLQKFKSAYSFLLMALPCKYWYCVGCQSPFSPHCKKDVRDHVQTTKHVHNMQFLTNRKAREDSNNASHVNAEQLGHKLYQVFISANILTHKYDN